MNLTLAPLDVPAALQEELSASLSGAEHKRAGYMSPPGRARWRVARGWLRRVLAEQLGEHPASVSIVADARGKPCVPSERINFSAARSGAWTLIATSLTAALGADLETVREVPDLQAVARRFFTAAERRWLDASSPEGRAAAFLECWTRKEAYGKGIGAGLDYDTGGLALWRGDRRAVSLPGWEILQPALSPGLVAAVAVATAGADRPARAGSNSERLPSHPYLK